MHKTTRNSCSRLDERISDSLVPRVRYSRLCDIFKYRCEILFVMENSFMLNTGKQASFSILTFIIINAKASLSIQLLSVTSSHRNRQTGFDDLYYRYLCRWNPGDGRWQTNASNNITKRKIVTKFVSEIGAQSSKQMNFNLIKNL